MEYHEGTTVCSLPREELPGINMVVEGGRCQQIYYIVVSMISLVAPKNLDCLVRTQTKFLEFYCKKY